MAQHAIPKWPLSLRQTRRPWLALSAAVSLGVLALLLGAVHIARADMAPFPAQEGTSLGVAGPTDIRMMSETVVIQVTDLSYTDSFGDLRTGLGAAVTADFLLVNPEASAQELQVGFPLDVPAQTANAGNYIKLFGLRAFVAGAEATTQISTVGPETWSAWQMSFAPGTTQVRVTYNLPATVDACSAELGYVLHTGAAWAGAIGQADLIVRYPYAAEATFLSPHGIYLGDTTGGYQVAGNDLRWHYDNLEPTKANDLAVTFVTPDCWRSVAAARVALNAAATAENYWHLASTYADIVFPHHGFYSPLIAEVADAQYQKALALDPQNPQLNAEYAEFLTYHVGYLLSASRASSEIQQCIKALQLAPDDDQLSAMCGPVAADAIDSTEAAQSAQSTETPVLTAAPPPTVPAIATSTTAASATATAAALLSPVQTATTLPPGTATRAATSIAALAATPGATAGPAPTAPASPLLLWRLVAVIIAVVVLLIGGWIFWRRRNR